MVPKVPDTLPTRLRYRWYRLRVSRNWAACARRSSRVPIMEYGMYPPKPVAGTPDTQEQDMTTNHGGVQCPLDVSSPKPYPPTNP
jgi:hypothetical protein